MKWRFITVWLCLTVYQSVFCNSRIISPEVHADGSVTFRYQNEKAKRVKIVSDCLRKRPDHSAFGEKTRRERMQRDTNGIWTFTTKMLPSEVYFYYFVVDGKRIHDPLNEDSTFILLHQVSQFTVASKEPYTLYLPASPEHRGRIDSFSYYSERQGINRQMVVYLPPNHNPSDSLPILYLFHGICGDERQWLERGKVASILDNLIANGMARPMIVVMPDCNVVRGTLKNKRTKTVQSFFNYATLCRGDFERDFSELEAAIASRYAVSSAPEKRAIAGLSSGARQALNIINLYPENFGTVGLFSPVLKRKQLPKLDTIDTDFYIYIGQNDLFYKNGKRHYQRLQTRNFSAKITELDEGHTWRSWRMCLTDFLPLLFLPSEDVNTF